MSRYLSDLDWLVEYGTRAEKVRMVRHCIAVAHSVWVNNAYGRRAIAAMYLDRAAIIRRSITPQRETLTYRMLP